MSIAAPAFEKIAMDEIGYLKKYYPRINGKEDWFTVNVYREVLETNKRKADYENHPNEAFPPIVVVKTSPKVYKQTGFKYLIIDGLHRFKAFAICGMTTICAYIERIPEKNWFRRSVELNSDSKRGFSPQDKAYIAQTLKSQGSKMSDIAKLLQMKIESLEKIYVNSAIRLPSEEEKAKMTLEKRNSLSEEDRMQSRNCRFIQNKETGEIEAYGFKKSAMKDATGARQTEAALENQQYIVNREVLGILKSFLGILKAGQIDMENEKIAELMGEIKQLL